MNSAGGVKLCIGGQNGTVASLSLATEGDGLLALEADFAQETHIGAVRSMAIGYPTLITGGADEVVRVYDVSRRRERGVLAAHNGEVGAVALFSDFTSKCHALTGGTSGTLCVWRARDWRLMKTMQAHTAPVLAIGAHPTGTLALSTSSDRALFMWDLGRGKVVFSAKTKGNPVSRIVWTDEGESYFMAAGSVVSVNTVEGKSSGVMQHEKCVADISVVNQAMSSGLITGCEDGVVRLWDARAASVQRRGPIHDRKITGVSTVNELVVSADVRGGLKVWDLRSGSEPRIETNVGISVRCLEATSMETLETGSKSSRKRVSDRLEVSQTVNDMLPQKDNANVARSRKKKRRSRR